LREIILWIVSLFFLKEEKNNGLENLQWSFYLFQDYQQ